MGVEVGRIETGSQFGILVFRQSQIVHDPFALPHHAVNAPVDKDAELVILEILTRL